jgi:hypothetical protein
MRRSFSSNSRTSNNRTFKFGSVFIAAFFLAGALSACGGSGGSGGSDTPPPSGSEAACATGIEPDLSATLSDAPVDTAAIAAKAAERKERVDGSSRGRLLDALWLNRARAGRARPRSTAATAGRESIDIGDIAVIQDEGELVESPNPYDLRSLGLRFTRNAAGGYDVARVAGGFRTDVGTRLTLTDDDSRQVNVPFAFPFYGGTQTTAFVNSDGNITFEEEDRASTDRNVGRLLSGPPRVAPFLADLDPSTAGRVLVNPDVHQYTVTWCGVRGFESTQTTNVQVSLFPSGVIEMKFGTVTLAEAIVGLSPGHTGDFVPVNLSDNSPSAGGSAAVGERFATIAQLDIVELAKKFYRTHSDSYDQLVIWTDQSLIDDAFAFEATVANEIRGIGLGIFDASGDFGSGGRLRSYTMMDFLGKYPDDPQQTFLGENNTVSVLGQEVGHRWLAFLEFRDHTGTRSEALLGRDQAHWSFFLDSDASVMEGNDIEDLGGGSFRTVGAVRRFSLLDQYAMGLIPESQVPTFFYVQNPVNVTGDRTATSAPRIGVTFNGTRRDVLISDVVAILGPRSPSAAESPRVHRQAFIYVVSAGRSPDSAQVAKVDRIRRAWEAFFSTATDGRMQAVTALQ